MVERDLTTAALKGNWVLARPGIAGQPKGPSLTSFGRGAIEALTHSHSEVIAFGLVGEQEE